MMGTTRFMFRSGLHGWHHLNSEAVGGVYVSAGTLWDSDPRMYNSSLGNKPPRRRGTHIWLNYPFFSVRQRYSPMLKPPGPLVFNCSRKT